MNCKLGLNMKLFNLGKSVFFIKARLEFRCDDAYRTFFLFRLLKC